MESSENGHIGIRASPSKKVVVSIDQLKCTYTNTCSMDNKQEELETTVHLENYNTVAITETWWDNSHDWSAAMGGCRLVRRDRQGRGTVGVTLCERECFDCPKLNEGN